tara:strand:+ start:3888 stop:4040 length:153 start_codon:yes stop_codon:yes gene_type:complete
MAKKKSAYKASLPDKKLGKKKRTSIGSSRQSRPKSKNKKQNWKRYRGQGR